MPSVLTIGLWLMLLLTGQAAIGGTSPEDLCDLAARDAAAVHRVPLKVLLAVSRVESGRQGENGLTPWPWAVNLGGEGHWAPTVEDAIQIAQRALDEGRLNIDIGCFQLNIRWHSKGFASLRDMFEPQQNADYAAAFLAELYRETGDWQAAIGKYHSRDTTHAAAYSDRVSAVVAQTNVLPIGNERRNAFPLLQTGVVNSPGSLFPDSETPPMPLFGKSS